MEISYIRLKIKKLNPNTWKLILEESRTINANH